ncbi:hypothetical protein AMJ52_02885 [candidate division TA06 bacterium DG_78]|uniref:DUF5668 domain-containing protein n=1 Tax=candidate division TA06 bacterium DG_78 TaxID=1703772 RepID=A0A0S7YGF4_UNCT6|nr:MAG: hypothetical protein AMJ52_02885 [candidate division TA06 bacterium DG_78]
MWIIVLVFLGVFFWFCNLGVLVLTRDWPLLLIFFGILNMYGLFRRNKKEAIIQDLEKGKITPQEAEEKLKK